MKRRIPHRNLSPHGWWIATFLIRAKWSDDPAQSENRRCLAWENTVILKAADREVAYEKAVKLAKADQSQFTDAKGKRKGRWIFEGLTSLLPIHEELEDGAEILWVEHNNKTVRKIRSLTKSKRQLEAFDDTLAIGDSNT